MTAAYNAALRDALADTPVELIEVTRMRDGGEPISASRVRAIIDEGDDGKLLSLLPKTTIDYLTDNKLI
jgi:[citrate (pro-3S)-lyase] ligase